MKLTRSIEFLLLMAVAASSLVLAGCEAEGGDDDDATPQPTPGDDDDDDDDDDDTSDDDTSDDDTSSGGSDEWDSFSIDLGKCEAGDAAFSLDWTDDQMDLDFYAFDALDPKAEPLVASELYQPPDPPHEEGSAFFGGPIIVQVHCYAGAGGAYEVRIALDEAAGRGGDDDSAAGDDDSAAGDDDSAAGDDDSAAGDDDSAAGDDDTTGDDDSAGDDDSSVGDDDDDVAGPCSAGEVTVAEVEPNDGTSETDMHFITLEGNVLVITGSLDLCPN